LFRHAAATLPIAALPISLIQTAFFAALVAPTTLAKLGGTAASPARLVAGDLAVVAGRAKRDQLPASGLGALEEPLRFQGF
jgi:hypothetical protein